MSSQKTTIAVVALLGGLFAANAQAHDPIFGIGPHVLYKGGIEISPELHTEKRGSQETTGLGLELTYGITGDWAAGVDLPYTYKTDTGTSASGLADVSAFTKYRFWRRDTLGLQESAAVMLKVKAPTASTSTTPPLGSGATDVIAGLAYGYESRKWYRWASLRYRQNGRNNAGLKRGDKVLIDFVGGIRTRLTSYLQPDTVWLLELNGEFGQQADNNGTSIANTGGTEWFVSPGIFWTKRNFAVKAGIQIPVYSALNGTQARSDYRTKTTLEWHL
ncbi:MAG: hypothetical protein ACC641_00385 [Acidiferrobacterales bacterium]